MTCWHCERREGLKREALEQGIAKTCKACNGTGYPPPEEYRCKVCGGYGIVRVDYDDSSSATKDTR